MAGLYVVGAWLVVQVIDSLLPMFGAPGWIARTVVILMAVGFVPALVFAWIFELTPRGLKRDAEVLPSESIAPQTVQRMNRTIMAMLAIALAYFALDKFVLAPQRTTATMSKASDAATSKPVSEPIATAKHAPAPNNSIAVLPFVNMSSDKEQEYFSDGLSEELLNQLAQLPQLRARWRISSALLHPSVRPARP